MNELVLRPVKDDGSLGDVIGRATPGDDGTIMCTGSPVLAELVAAIVARFRCDEATAFKRLVADGWSNGKLVLAEADQEEGTMGARVDLGRLHNLAETARQRMTRDVEPKPRSQTNSWYRIENAAPNGDASASVYLYDMIGEWGITAQDFVNDLRTVSAKSIDLHVNCEGGEVFDGLAIYETLRRHPADITAYVDGIAASSASFIVQAANRIVMAPRGRMMIHDAHGIVMGNARDMREMATLLDDLSDTIADIYAERGGGTRGTWRAAMAAGSGGPDGTWLDAGGAVRAGLADEVQGQEGTTPPVATWTPAQPGDTPGQLEPQATWDPSAFLSAIDEISNPPVPVKIPDGKALFEGLFGQ